MLLCLLQFLLQLLEEIQRLQRRQSIHVHLFNTVHNSLREGSEDGQLHRLRRCLHLHALPLLLFVLLQHVLRPFDYRSRQSRQFRHFDAIALARGSRLNRMEKDNTARTFLQADPQIPYALQLLR